MQIEFMSTLPCTRLKFQLTLSHNTSETKLSTFLLAAAVHSCSWPEISIECEWTTLLGLFPVALTGRFLDKFVKLSCSTFVTAVSRNGTI